MAPENQKGPFEESTSKKLRDFPPIESIQRNFVYSFMHLSPSTSALVDALDAFSQHKLTRKNDLGILLELATQADAKTALQELSFTAKFISRTYGIMQRVGAKDRAYEGLSRQFAEQLERAETLGRSLLRQAPVGTQEAFASTYYARSPEALERHLALLYDLSWYKNWLIDHRTE